MRGVVIPLSISVLGAFLGMFLPIVVHEITRSDSFELHNVFWESVFGLGLYLAGFFGTCMSDRWVGIVGLIAWPLVAMTLTYIITHVVLHRSSRARLGWLCLFGLSLLVYVGEIGEHFLSTHHLPLYWNLYASCY